MEETSDFDITNPPRGAWIKQELDSLVLGTSSRIWMGYFWVLFLTCWTGSVFFGELAIKGTVLILVIPLGLIILALFWWIGLLMVWGKVVVTIDSKYCTIFKGVFIFGRIRKCKLNKLVVEEYQKATWNGSKYLVLKYKENFINKDSLSYSWKERELYDYLLLGINKVLLDKKNRKNFLKQTFIMEDLSKHLIDNDNDVSLD